MRVLSWDIGTENLSYCLVDCDEEILDWDVFSLIDKKNDIQSMCKRLYKELDDRQNLFDDETYVRVEDQPIMGRITMKCIQMAIYCYYLTKATDKSKIELISPIHKLKVYDGPKVVIKEVKDKRINNKRHAIEYCKYFLKDREMDYDFFMEHEKRDDLADTYLMCKYTLKTLKKI